MKLTVYKEKQQPALMVDNEDLNGTYNWHDAKEEIESLNNQKYKGFDNWRLPTKDELNELYKNKDKVGGFSSSYYWSSTEYNDLDAWYQYFYNSYHYYDYKDYNFRVRCVRDL